MANDSSNQPAQSIPPALGRLGKWPAGKIKNGAVVVDKTKMERTN